MKRYLIKDAKYGITEGGIACGPVEGNVVVTVKFNDGESDKWLNVVYVMGTLNFCSFDKDMHDEIMTENDDSIDLVNLHTIYEFDGHKLGMDYSETLENLSEEYDDCAAELIKYILYLSYMDEETTNKAIKESIGKYVDQINIPLEEMEEELS